METKEKLLDTRRTYTFYVDDAVIDHFASQIGLAGLGVYVLLVRHAKHNRAFPSIRRISTLLGMSHSTIMRAIKTLQKYDLIDVEKRKSKHGDADSNLYIIKDLSHMHGCGFTTVTPPLTTVTGCYSGDTTSYHQSNGVVSPEKHGGVTRVTEGVLLKESHLRKEEENCASNAQSVSCDEKIAPPKKTKQPYSQGFIQFWDAYPVKKDKDRAWQAWRKLKLEPSVAHILQSITDHQHYDQQWERGYIKHPATFLNAGAWKDEFAQSSQSPPRRKVVL